LFVVTDQRLTGLIAPITPMFAAQGEWLGIGGGVLTTYSEIYRRQSAVRSVVDFLAGHLARMPWKVMQRESPVQDTHLFDHPAQSLLADPNRWRANQNWWRDFWLDWLIYDRVGAVKIKDPVDGGTFQLIRIPAVWYTPFGQNYWHPDKLRIIGNRGFGDFDIDQCLYVHGYDPVDPRIGTSPMETMRTILEEEAQSQLWRRRFWDGNAQPSMIVSRPLDAPDWEDGARDRFVVSLSAAANRGKPLVLEEGMTAGNNEGQFDPKNSQYIEGRQFTRDEVGRFYGLPAGIFDSQNFSNVLQYRQFLYSEILISPLGRAADELTTQLLPEWWTEPRKSGIRVVPGIEEAIRGSLTEQVAALQSAVGIPFVTREEARVFVSLPTDETDMGKLAIPVNYTIGEPPLPPAPLPAFGGQGGAPDNPATAAGGNNVGDNGKPEIGPVSPKASDPAVFKALTAGEVKQVQADRVRFEDRHATELVKFFARQGQTVKSRAGAGNKKFSADRWNKELAAVLFPLASETAEFFGTDTAEKIKGTYDADYTVNYLTRGSEMAAVAINEGTASRLENADDPADVFVNLQKDGGRLQQIVISRVTYAMNFGILDCARQSGHGDKK
jgi:HK97 family phage portal protein